MLQVLSGDGLWRERRLRALRDDLDAALGSEVTVAPTGPGTSTPGSKGTVESTAMILVASAPIARPSLELLTATITAWLQRDRRTTIRATRGDATIEMTGEPTDGQQDLLRAILASESSGDPGDRQDTTR